MHGMQKEKSNELRIHNVLYLMSVYLEIYVEVNWGSRDYFPGFSPPRLSLACSYFRLSWMLSPDQCTLMNVESRSVPRWVDLRVAAFVSCHFDWRKIWKNWTCASQWKLAENSDVWIITHSWLTELVEWVKISKRWWTHFDRSLSHAPQFSPFLVWIWKFSSLSLKITRGSHNLFFVPSLPKNGMCVTGAKKKDISATQSTLRNIIFMNLVIFGILNT